jgi:hypothetical protein
VKTTQISCPQPDARAQELPSLATSPTPSTLPALELVAGAIPEARRIHHLRDGAVVLYRRSRSQVWQVRYKLEDRRWHLSTTAYRELAYALKAAGTIYDRARFKEELGLPQRTAGFGAVAALCLKQLDAEIEQGLRPMTNKDYQRAIRKYLIPHFGKYNLTSIDNNLVREFELWRNQQIGIEVSWREFLLVNSPCAGLCRPSLSKPDVSGKCRVSRGLLCCIEIRKLGIIRQLQATKFLNWPSRSA